MSTLKSIVSAPAFWFGLAFICAVGFKMQAVKQSQHVKLKLDAHQEVMASFAI